jgi:hypothetical protein
VARNPVISEILRQGRRRKQKHVLAALATGKVESGFRNLKYGDADSQGWRQERASLYPNPTNLKASVRRFYQEAEQHDRGQSAGELAADVQRPAEQYRGRYREVMSSVKPLLKGGGGGGGGYARSSSSATGRRSITGFSPAMANVGQQTVFDKKGYEAAGRKALLAQFLQKSGKGNSVLFRTGLLSTEAPDPSEFSSTRTTSSLKMAGPLKFSAAQRQAQGGRGGRAQGGGKVPASGRIEEFFYDPMGGWDRSGKKLVSIGAIGGHSDHVHVAGDPRLMLDLGRAAKRMGLAVRENPAFDPVDYDAHTTGSWHYKTGTVRGGRGKKRKVGYALDISGDAQTMAAFARRVRKAHRF